MRKILFSLCCLIFSAALLAETAKPEYRQEISQYGITWTFDKPVQCGQFITGDWWVIGPVKIIRITPEPGPVRTDSSKLVKNRWGDTSLKTDTRMRNGSMVVYTAGFSHDTIPGILPTGKAAASNFRLSWAPNCRWC
jgi:hypothetical protein